jgi:uncharacterized protein (UPF0216 family)
LQAPISIQATRTISRKFAILMMTSSTNLYYYAEAHSLMSAPPFTSYHMPPPSDFSDESVLKKWMAIEMGRMNDAVVSERRRLSDLLLEKNPSALTRKGKDFSFDCSMLQQLDQRLPEELRRRLLLPVIFYFDSRLADSCFMTDETAMKVFQTLGELSALRTMTNGKLWIGRAIVFAMIRKYPTMIQIMMC